MSQIHTHSYTHQKHRPATNGNRKDILDDVIGRFGQGKLRQVWRHFITRTRCQLWAVSVAVGKVTKRSIDIFVAASMLLMLLPLFFFVAAAIKLTDRGPVLFWQIRVGQNGREFAFPKFRSMVSNAEKLKDTLLSQNDHGDGITFKMKRDPRITWIGRFIRKTSIDELPQLWSVLCGQMSLVGPRPPVPREVALYSLSDRRRLEATPGLTCIWQVSGRGDIPFSTQVALDVEYIESQTTLLDINLLVRTVPAVISGKGAY